MNPVLRNRGERGERGVGNKNFGNGGNNEADALTVASALETDPLERQALVKKNMMADKEAVNFIPLHRQLMPWAVRQNFTAVHSPANSLSLDGVTTANRSGVAHL